MCFFPVFASQHRHAHQGHGFRFIFVKSPFIIGYFCSTCHSKVCLSSMSLVHKSVCRIDCCCIFFSTDALHHCLLQFMPLQYRTYEPRHARVAVVCMRARHPRRMMSKTKHSWMRMSWRRRHLWDSTVIVHAQSGLYAWEDIARHRGMLRCLLLLPNLWLVSQRMVCEKVCGKGYVFCWPEHSAGVVDLARRIGGGC